MLRLKNGIKAGQLKMNIMFDYKIEHEHYVGVNTEIVRVTFKNFGAKVLSMAISPTKLTI